MASASNRSVGQNKESITLIWFDSDIDENENTEDIKTSLRSINDYVLIYTNVQECVSYIKSVRNEKMILVSSGTSTPFLLSLVVDLKQLDRIFIFCAKPKEYLYLKEKYSKISGVFSDREDLNSNIRNNIHLLNKQLETVSFFDKKQSLSMDLLQQTSDFLRFQLFHDVIFHLPSDKQAKQQMINACRHYYRGNEKELELINEFERSYTSKDCIRWYTRETFVYRMVNKALRAEDIQQLHTFRFIINDLSSALAREHNKMLQESDDEMIITVYRGGQIPITEFEKFRSNQGTLISINGYLSTSRLRDRAVGFADINVIRMDWIPVLFEIKCEREESNYFIFADISKLSSFPKEQEVLFDLGSVFKVETVRKDDDLWKICLSTTDDGREIATQYIEETKKEMQEDSVTILFGRLMIRMGHYESAQTYFEQLLEQPGKENLATIHNQLGLIRQAKAEFRKAMRHFDTAYELMKRSRTPRLRESAHVLCNMSQVLRQQGHYEKALEYCILAKQELEELNDSCQLEIAHCLHSIGSSNRGLRKHTEALEYYQEALNIKQTCLPENHVYIAKTLNSIGIVYLMMKNIEKAFNFSLSSFEMYQTCLPEDHPDIANVLHTIAECYQNKNQFDNALQHYQMALAMKEKCYPPGHPSIATTLNNISTALSSKGEKMKALDICLKALSMRERVLPYDHPDIAASLTSVGLRYEAMEENQHALEYFEKALEMRTLSLSEDDPVRKRTEKHILRIKRKLM